MNISTTIRPDGVAVLSADGRLNVVTAPAMRREVQRVVEEGSARVAVDLSGVDFIDSSGLGALVSGLKTARTAGGDLRLSGAGEQVSSVLALTRLDRILRVYAGPDDAYRE
ncbi:STAS domain-containing protein [Leifsonia sp. F6_8S_P_1B]|uniref:Anti-sigma factor antagonist n=1 Tax=Leifsonia williamsii TaxID=3035919 RepID=A0ABT8K8H6_9MICO|nr:STAS domain-containing protein [Leifsonia williamsii]MDN4613770.1 STAS domain-containing protein [Leifsonia williamsii]